jgi:putative intracellular protease/amidase
MLKKVTLALLICVVALGIALSAFLYWSMAFFPEEEEIVALRATQAEHVDYLKKSLPPTRGKILAIVTSVKAKENDEKPIGYELSELARAYWVFTVNGFTVDVASPQGGEPYALLDEDDMAEYDYAFLNDRSAQAKTKNTLSLKRINPDDYQAIYFVGGKGAMFDFPDNPAIHNLISHFAERKKVIGAVCHGPAALVNIKAADGTWLVENKNISAFTNSEELLLMPKAGELLPFLLQSRLEQRGANFIAGNDYLEQVTQQDYLITGQNPWSVWALAEKMIQQLGYEPLPRSLTPEEQSIKLLQLYRNQGLSVAEKAVQQNSASFSGQLILMHSFVAAMRGDLWDMVKLIILADNIRAA